MTPAADGHDDQTEALKREIDRARAVLTALRSDIVAARSALADTASQRLREANEQLVLAIVRAQEEIARSAAALDPLSRLAYLDGLTGLPNRTLFHDRFVQAAATARRHGEKMAVVFIDLDDFKHINDSLGHAAGDELLRAVAVRLTGCVRQGDTVCRYGGDEFVVLLCEVAGSTDVGAMASKLQEAIAGPVTLRGQDLRIGASLGISLFPDDAATDGELIELADAAMYRAKQRGGSTHAFHGAGSAFDADPDAATVHPEARARPHRPDHEATNQLLREANQRLVLATLGARDLTEAAEKALLRHRQYLALLGHEIRSPLSPLRSAAEVLARGPHGEDVLTQLRRIIERQVVQIARLVDDMLAMSFASRAQLAVAFDEVDIVALARQAVNDCMSSIDARAQTVRLHSDAPSQMACADGGRVVQIITNLLDNASKYTPVNGYIVVEVRGDPAEVMVSVRDNGMGIAATAMPTLFEPFARAPEAVTSGSSGMGIGLTVVRELVDAHHGAVEVRSDGPSQGAEFTVRLPRVQPR